MTKPKREPELLPEPAHPEVPKADPLQLLNGRLDAVESVLLSISEGLKNVPSRQSVEAFVKDTLAEYHARTQSTTNSGTNSLLSMIAENVVPLFKGGGSGQAEMEQDVGHKMFLSWAKMFQRKWAKELGMPEHEPVRLTLHAEEPKA